MSGLQTLKDADEIEPVSVRTGCKNLITMSGDPYRNPIIFVYPGTREPINRRSLGDVMAKPGQDLLVTRQVSESPWRAPEKRW